MAKKKPVFLWLSQGQWPINIGFTLSRKAFAREFKALGGTGNWEESWNVRGARTWFFENPPNNLFRTYVITIGEETMELGSPEVAAIVAHEAVHVFQRLMKSIGEKKWGEETEAYFVQYVTRAILIHLWG